MQQKNESVNVAIKGIKEGLLIALSPTEEWNSITTDLASRIDEQSAFFAGARIAIDVGARPVRKHELGSLKALLERRGLTLWAVLSESRTTIDAADAFDLKTSLGGTLVPTRSLDEETQISPQEEGTDGIMIRHTLRSGRLVRSAGHVVIYGDVNPGAEIVAAGDVIVWGCLRGNVHAGARGDETAVVCALDMTPNQLRIAGQIVTSPKEKNHKARPEIALMRDGRIIVEAWT